MNHEPREADGLLVEERPLAAFLYALMRDGDVAPRRLEQVLGELEQMPPAIAVRFDLEHLARYAAEAASRLERLPRAPIRVTRAERV
jgi:hypothetical protein